MKHYEKTFYLVQPDHSSKAGWSYQLYETPAGVGYLVFDESGEAVLDQPPTQNAPRAGMTKEEAEVCAIQAIENLPCFHLPYRYELYASTYGTGFRVFDAEGRPWIEQPFAPGVSGFAGMTPAGARLLARATILQLPTPPKSASSCT